MLKVGGFRLICVDHNPLRFIVLTTGPLQLVFENSRAMTYAERDIVFSSGDMKCLIKKWQF